MNKHCIFFEMFDCDSCCFLSENTWLYVSDSAVQTLQARSISALCCLNRNTAHPECTQPHSTMPNDVFHNTVMHVTVYILSFVLFSPVFCLSTAVVLDSNLY